MYACVSLSSRFFDFLKTIITRITVYDYKSALCFNGGDVSGRPKFFWGSRGKSGGLVGLVGGSLKKKTNNQFNLSSRFRPPYSVQGRHSFQVDSRGSCGFLQLLLVDHLSTNTCRKNAERDGINTSNKFANGRSEKKRYASIKMAFSQDIRIFRPISLTKDMFLVAIGSKRLKPALLQQAAFATKNEFSGFESTTVKISFDYMIG